MSFTAERDVRTIEVPTETEVVVLTMSASDASLIRYHLYCADQNRDLSAAEKEACQRAYDALVEVSSPHV